MSVAVIIVAHNHADYVEESILSVKRQTKHAVEVVCIDDASDPTNAAETERMCTLYGIPYYATKYGHPTPARRYGLALTSSPFLIFLDADDYLQTDYIEAGLKCFETNYRVGLVYSDYKRFGEVDEHFHAPDAIPMLEQVWSHNLIHAGSIVRRDALIVSDAMRDHGSMDVWEDWYAWRRVLQEGFAAVKSPSMYFYRKHPTNRHKSYCHRAEWFDQAGLFDANVEVFTALSGREWAISSYFQWLNKLEWSPKKLSIWLHDTSGDDFFHGTIRTGIYQLPWDVKITRGDPIRKGLADLPRGENSDGVRLACARIYNRLARESTGDFVLVVEDDILPRTDVVESLLRGFGPRTASVAGPYRSRFHGGYVAWQTKRGDWKPQLIEKQGTGIQKVTGNGFGCTMLRGDVLRDQVMTFRDPLPDYDMAFYHRLGVQGWERLVDWSQEPQHRYWDGRTIKAVQPVQSVEEAKS